MRRIASAFLLLAAFPLAPSQAAAEGKRLNAFNGCDSLIAYGDHFAEQLYGPDYQPPEPPPFDPNAPTPPTTSGMALSGAAPAEDSSTTNVQEEGVDEPDIVKNDGSRIFAIVDDTLHAIDARSNPPRLLGSIELEGFGHELLRVGHRLLVISGDFGTPPSTLPAPASPGGGVKTSRSTPGYDGRPSTLLTEVNVGDAREMRIVRTQRVDGYLISARLTGGTARVVVSSTPAVLREPPSRLRSPLAGWVPYSEFENHRTGKETISPVLGPCREIRRPPKFSGLSVLSVLTVDLSRGLPIVDADAVMTDAEIVYASPENLYVATTRWEDFVEANEGRLSTAIHKFDASTATQTRYRASGSVRGYLLNQFSLSEHEGFLRAASTTASARFDDDRSEAFLTVLDQRGDRLERVGRVGGMGRGEHVYAVRMIEDNGFVVTFRNVDPLYTLDLSSPQNPRVLGELKIRGYSAYLHPISENRLLGIGQDATKEGDELGTQISLFDVSNLRRPVRLEHRTVAGGYSEAEYNHHAFLYWPPSGLAVLPVDAYESRNEHFYGAIGYQVGASGGIDEVRRITHRGGAGGAAPIRRSLIVRKRLFTVSCRGVEMADLDTLAELAWVSFPGGHRTDCDYYYGAL